ncbi:D-alanyl-D-alanine carboxypeptidase/D-alanyl-D-alanine-endopeptidase [Deinococcus radiodurans]|uniref:D-alanyl-D-alanine carboxypeptidase, putative n=1 Tax=Deinococcus radiodurans (strain ATCC 13939 / DSM 20539 / JCM 16871 / CCUG 27074 / LMG 4051 / NBRC 15346 / NCIMB 9279 / VKM B-1422 / R1) TaxID=243230 RepID=Q9RXX9_DEIRA|nr:D-alanyl-D-alanine carboxypeptidase/D-alanyl-D-alanine-endopeptidase [Deinococcus radiodurans]AAF09764.1 D-alanyl-D-alanine carboxypeptidase, putative [Deinococcus radiodurans R1 = ATCC 13939 = DSM 20539]ANC72547.1 D-alanyl-D-alanine carboxypeptidase [Deinococcus radiodurans R1 = ATCC 13939 = DSM 20539]QEM72141.1 D-alanyl-D-alanine carboxypeptidase [Deinococcus radiodurans]UDK99376.1 D-alanyl-D-alanine carboxypeptidase [Deinococcus radiodurans R1 = ATCC 13939 = DSM 20539]UID69184.1 D-alanyl
MRRFLLLSFLLLPVAAQSSTPAPPAQATQPQPAPAPSVTLEREPLPTGALAHTLAEVPRPVRTGLLVRDLNTGKVLVALDPDRPLVPASTMKLVTAAAVLYDRGGAGGWWSTELTVPAPDTGKGHVSALTLRGSGDPTLSVSGTPNSLRALAEQAHTRGIRAVDAVRIDTLPLDATSFEATELGLAMPAVRLREWENRPPTSAAEARRRLGATLIAELRRVGITVAHEEVTSAPAYRPYVPPPRQDEKGRPLPPDLLIPLSQRPEQGVASVRSGSPFPFLASTLRPSDNLRAEALLATVAVRPGETGTLKSALKREQAILQRLGLDLSDVVLEDGSGLGRGNRLTPRLLTGLLRELYTLPYPTAAQYGRELPPALYHARHNAFAELLPQAGTGEDVPDHDGRGGTLARRLVGTGLDVRAKTGTLPGVSALAGYLTAKSGRPLAFAVLMNGPEDSPILTLRALQDQAVRDIAAAF